MDHPAQSQTIEVTALPSEIIRSNMILKNIIEVLENTFLSTFHDELDAAKVYTIVSGQTVDDSLKKIFVTRGS